MAEGTKLVLGFEGSEGNTIIMSFNYAKPSATAMQVKNLMKGIIDNGDIFASVPVIAKSATAVTTSEIVYDLDK